MCCQLVRTVRKVYSVPEHVLSAAVVVDRSDMII